MVVLVAAFARSRLRSLGAASAAPELTAPVRRWLLGVTYLFVGLYAGWMICDVLILAGVEIAHVLRIVPNVLYYGALLWVVFATAPPEATAASTSATSLPSAGSSLGTA
jgi:hypothetical protein